MLFFVVPVSVCCRLLATPSTVPGLHNVLCMQASTVLGQSKAGLLNKVHALEAANVPANGTEVMKVDGS